MTIVFFHIKKEATSSKPFSAQSFNYQIPDALKAIQKVSSSPYLINFLLCLFLQLLGFHGLHCVLQHLLNDSCLHHLPTHILHGSADLRELHQLLHCLHHFCGLLEWARHTESCCMKRQMRGTNMKLICTEYHLFFFTVYLFKYSSLYINIASRLEMIWLGLLTAKNILFQLKLLQNLILISPGSLKSGTILSYDVEQQKWDVVSIRYMIMRVNIQ